MNELLWDALLDAIELENKSLPKTIVHLTKRPGLAIRQVIHGRRQSLYPPFKFLVVAGAIVIVSTLRYHFFSNEYTGSNGVHALFGIIAIPQDYHVFFQNFFAFAEGNATLLNIAAIPIFAVFSWSWLSGSVYNFAENLVLNTFITGQQLFFLILLIPFLEFFPESKNLLMLLYIAVTALYNVSVYVEFFGSNSRNFFKSIATVLAAYIGQFPLNLLIFYLYDDFIKGFFH